MSTISFGRGSRPPQQRTVHEVTRHAKGIWPDNAEFAINFAKEGAADLCRALTGSAAFKIVDIRKADYQVDCENYYYGTHRCDGATIRFTCSRRSPG